ncbi:hypothetical protein GRI39_06830 [Altererythrobacter indicus]|uniref:Uncharacterized protein n=1 Tax=Altericroceibacterium indicum TaxID=374177 RepID=A0A845A891_9SPHN|nr:hypothetical protein [Altericroceibacterium indicum]MXP25757.1 hypothetical protein [Altericroceibacterium indicum]
MPVYSQKESDYQFTAEPPKLTEQGVIDDSALIEIDRRLAQLNQRLDTIGRDAADLALMATPAQTGTSYFDTPVEMAQNQPFVRTAPSPASRPLPAERFADEVRPAAQWRSDESAKQPRELAALAYADPAGPGARRAIPPRQREPLLPPAGILPQRGSTEEPAGQKRWSADGWLLLRPDDDTSAASSQPSYGRSQAGAVLRYRLAPGSDHRPSIYGRFSGALQGVEENEAAAGLSIRPLKDVPLSFSVEGRVLRSNGRYSVRPSAFAVTEFPPLELPMGLRAQSYVQGGYVGGKWKTAFLDGQARVDGQLLHAGPASVRLGVGAWGGAQKGSARIDAGPGLAAQFRLGRTVMQMAADWRFRLGGNAQPGSGPALSVSAGF